MGNPASKSRWIINSATQGNKRLRRVESSKVSTDSGRETVTAQGEDTPIGHIKKVGGISISFTVYEEEGIPEADYRRLNDLDEWFTLDRQIVNGYAYQYGGCQVSKVEPSGDNGGKNMFDVEIVALTEKRV
jgi:hypothetical protein